MIVGEPRPQYILFRYYGPEEKRIIAGTQHNLDLFDDITPESWDILRAQDSSAKTFLNTFPWADMDDPCERGIQLLDSKPPFVKTEVRWAFALATDIENVSQATFAGALRVSPLPVPPVSILQNAYGKSLRDWLTSFALPDGYKPFNADFATNFAKKMIDQGVSGIPTDPQAQIDLFGVGWWKYDIAEATKLMNSAGGELQRISVALGLIPRPKLIVADEPVSMIDASLRMNIVNMFLSLKEKYNVSFI